MSYEGSRIPNLPGYRQNPQVSKSKTSGFKDNDPDFGSMRLSYSENNSIGSERNGPTFAELQASELNRNAELKFLGYFKEKISSGNEKFRIRVVVISFDMKTNNMSIVERKVKNSGMPQGNFLKPARLPRPNNQGFYGAGDLKIGFDIMVYSRRFHICGCDVRTRDFLSERGIDMPPDEQIPTDNFSIASRGTSQTASSRAANAKQKKYLEAASGGKVGSTEKLGAFLEYDRKVLSFECYWDDRASLYGDLNRYTLNYFLAEKKIEIREHVDPNSGKGTWAIMLSKARLPKNYESELSEIDKDTSDNAFYSDADLRIGSSVRTYGKELVLTSCDDFTKRYYKKVYGLTDDDMRPIVLLEDMPQPVPKKAPPPPYIGGVASFGTEEDSLQSCQSLHSKKTISIGTGNGGRKLRYQAIFASRKAEDEGRQFVLTYYPEDKTTSVYEMANKNSGIVPGKFLTRHKVKRADGSGYLEADDFYVGKVVQVNCFKFMITDTDKFTEESTVKVRDVMEMLHHTLRPLQDKAFALLDTGRTGVINLANLEHYIATRLGTKLSRGDMSVAMRFFDVNGDGQINHSEMINWLNKDPKEWPVLNPGDTLDTAMDRKYDKRNISVMDEAEYMRKVKNVMRRLAQSFEDKLHNFSQILVKHDKTKGGVVDRSQLINTLTEANVFAGCGKISGPGEGTDIEMLADYFFPENVKQLKYSHFVGIMQSMMASSK